MVTSHPVVLTAARAAVGRLLDTGRPRVVVGITGPPGAGKSTLAASLVGLLREELGADSTVAVPMDGFHLSNVELDRLGLTDRKGAPATFDAAGFVHLLRRLRVPVAGEIVYAPEYSRVLHESIGGAIPVFPGVRVVVVEGNYLLLPRPPWDQVRPLLDTVLYVDAPDAVRHDALVRRQQSRGLSPEAARDWVYRSDEANAELIAATRRYADEVLSRPGR